MTTIIKPTKADLDKLVAPYLKTQPSGLAFAIGYASPQFSPHGSLYFHGDATNQFGQPLTLDGNTPFQLASVSKTFTATLYALLIRFAQSLADGWRLYHSEWTASDQQQSGRNFPRRTGQLHIRAAAGQRHGYQ